MNKPRNLINYSVYATENIMKNKAIRGILVLLVLLLFSGVASALNWTTNNNIINGLPNIEGDFHDISVFNISSQWNICITTGTDPYFHFYTWNGTSWNVNNTLVTGLPYTPYAFKHPIIIFHLNGELYSIYDSSDIAHGIYKGSKWNGTSWNENSSITNGLYGKIITYGRVFYLDNNYYLLASRRYDDVSFYTWKGFKWNGTGWESNSAITNGLTTGDYEGYATISIPYINNNLYLLRYDYYNWEGYKWVSNIWVQNDEIKNGLSSLGGVQNVPQDVFFIDNYYLIYTDRFIDVWYGKQQQPEVTTVSCPIGWCYVASNYTSKTLLELDNMFSTDTIQGRYNRTSKKYENHRTGYAFNQYVSVEQKEGYYYYFTSAQDVTMTPGSTPSITLKTGWSLTSNYGAARTLAELKSSIGVAATQTQYYDRSSKSWVITDSQSVPAMEAFFVYVTSETPWSG